MPLKYNFKVFWRAVFGYPIPKNFNNDNIYLDVFQVCILIELGVLKIVMLDFGKITEEIDQI